MADADLILLHAPSVYDFRKTSILYGPVSDVVPSGPIFEMYPIGFATIAEFVERFGYNVRIINLAVRMLRSRRFNPEKLIKKLRPKIFGIDLHWLPHVHGSLEIAKIIKKYHPDIPVVFGGFTSTYFHKELINYPQVDMVMKGDSTERPIKKLLDAISNGQDFSRVPNLSWKNNKGKICHNPIEYIPEDINYIRLDYTYDIKSVFKFKDLLGHVPFYNFLKYPITAAFTCRGCNHTCVTCGGSEEYFKNNCCRHGTAFRDPLLLVEDIDTISQYFKGPIFILGDINQAGSWYGKRVIQGLGERKIKNQVCFEFFRPPTEEFFQMVTSSIPHYSIEVSLESHDYQIRKQFGKHYDNSVIEKMIGDALNNNCERIDIYFIIGLPTQTPQSVMDTTDYCEYLYRKFNSDKRILTFISPMAPFLDPGSIVFENPKKYGYRLFYSTLEEHRQALTNPSWKYILNYETDVMSRKEIVMTTYEAAKKLNKIKAKYKIIPKKIAEKTEKRIEKAQLVIEKIDDIIKKYPEENREKELRKLKENLDHLSISTVCEKSELEWPTGFFNFKFLNIAKLLLKDKFRKDDSYNPKLRLE